jgi:DNA-directed RNA polymerases I, II, and III subunit RPABC5
MIIPVRCFTCGKVLADTWNFYKNELKQSEDTIINVNAKTVQKTQEGKALDKVGLKRYCCRRVMLSHVDLVSSK